MGYSGAGRTVAILDTGVDKTHPFLSGKVVSEACYSTNSATTTSLCPGGVSQSTAAGSGVNCPTSIGGCNHGTHVAGIAAGKGATFSGVAKDASIIAIKVFTQFNTVADCGGTAPCILAYSSD
jgi:subtilisin family serine protease